MKTELVLAALAVALPTISVLIGILLSQSGMAKLETRLGQIEGRLDARINSVKVEVDARLNALEQRFHADMMLVIGKLTELEVRVTRLEEKQSQ